MLFLLCKEAPGDLIAHRSPSFRYHSLPECTGWSVRCFTKISALWSIICFLLSALVRVRLWAVTARASRWLPRGALCAQCPVDTRKIAGLGPRAPGRDLTSPLPPVSTQEGAVWSSSSLCPGSAKTVASPLPWPCMVPGRASVENLRSCWDSHHSEPSAF